MNKKRIIIITAISAAVILSGIVLYFIAKDIKSLDSDNKSENNSDSTLNYINNFENDYYLPEISNTDNNNENDNPY